MSIKITYLNNDGNQCECILDNPDSVIHEYNSSKKDFTGKYPRIKITAYQAFLKRLKGCSNISIKREI